jgi:hypothetical protein
VEIPEVTGSEDLAGPAVTLHPVEMEAFPPPAGEGVTDPGVAPRDPVTPKLGKAHPPLPKSPFPDGIKPKAKK